MIPETVELDYEQDRPGTVSSAVEPDELSTASEVVLNPLDDSSCDTVEKDLVVDLVERGAEVKQAK